MTWGDVAVWWQAGIDSPVDTSLLDAEERARADSFVFPHHRARFIRAHDLLRRVLARCTGRPADELRFQAGEYGKPDLVDGGDLAFNLSHSGEMAVVAVTRAARVGVDIEVVRPIEDRDGLVERFFSAAEVEAFGAAPVAERQSVFYRLWTRKEAYIKGLGLGLHLDLAAFTVSAGPEAWLLAPAQTSWRLIDLALDPEVAAALAIDHPLPRIALQSAEQA